MNSKLKELKTAHWDTLSSSEQRTIRRGAWVLLPLLAWGLLWQPAHEGLPKLQAMLPLLRAQATQMSIQASEVQTLRQRAQLAVLDSEALRSTVERSAGESGISFVVTPAEQNSVHISAEALSFEQWLIWLQALQRTQHIRVSMAMLSTSTALGKIKIQATLSNGADQ